MKLFQFTKNFDRSLLSTMFVVIGMFKKVVTIKSAILGAAVAQWIRLRFPFCSPRFESQANHLRFFHL